MSYRVDNIPALLKIPYWIFGYGGGFLYYLVVRLLSLSVRVKEVGREQLAPNQAYVFASWHREDIPLFVTRFFTRVGGKFVMLMHPSWHMKPIHVVLYFLGVKDLILGSTGHQGLDAANELVSHLKIGAHTHINPDGPAGPPFVLKKGVLHLAAQSGNPIVAVSVHCSKELKLKTWDGKRFPLPFSTLLLKYEKPLVVSADTIESSIESLSTALGVHQAPA